MCISLPGRSIITIKYEWNLIGNIIDDNYILLYAAIEISKYYKNSYNLTKYSTQHSKFHGKI